MNQFRRRFQKPKTQKAYKGHINAWLEKNSLQRYEAWTQRSVEAFLGEQIDEKKNPSEAVQMQRRAALKWLINDLLRLDKLNVNPFPIRRQDNKKGGHNYWTIPQIRQMPTVPEGASLKMIRLSLAGHLLYEIGGRSEDLLKLTYGQFTKEQNELKHGYCLLFYSGK